MIGVDHPFHILLFCSEVWKVEVNASFERQVFLGIGDCQFMTERC